MIPPVGDSGWCRTPVDRFILARLEAAELSPTPEADRATLLRRVTFDLTGLPPTIAEQAAFLDDGSPDAWDRVVERLLGSPAYGERWAQHWLDLARFAETDGFEHDLERPNAWRYRDWVISALNADLAYTEFVRLQLAGDELRPDDPAALVATGFLLCGPDMPDINLQEERRHIFLNDLTGTVGSTLLGLQVGCAQCHDHKYDPISQFDFYRLRAFFDSADLFREHPLPERDTPGWSAAQRELLATLHAAETEQQQLEDSARQKLRAENPDLQPRREDLVKALHDADQQRHEELAGAIASLKATLRPPQAPLGRIVRALADPSPPSRFLVRGDFRRRGPKVSPAYPRVANVSSTVVSSTSPEFPTTGHRAQLADWLASPDNPLAARVLVNRLWQHHFGRGLVETASDFGKMGADPTHPELLDWLAGEFWRNGGSLKALHRLIVTSAVYRQAGSPLTPGEPPGESAAGRAVWDRGRAVDPDNKLLWHKPRRRLEGEAIRDALLSSAASLNADRGGPGVRPPLPPELVAALLKDQWKVSPHEADHHRRSIYLFVRRNLRYPLFEAFDRPDANASCPRRNQSTIAPQALFLLNSEVTLDAARDLAGRLIRDAGTNGERIRLACRVALGREPSAEEAATALAFLDNQSSRLRSAGRASEDLALPRPFVGHFEPHAAAALVDWCVALFNLNEFVYID